MASNEIEIEVTLELDRVLETIALEVQLPVDEVIVRALAYGVVKQYKE
jgi:hypothetical protein